MGMCRGRHDETGQGSVGSGEDSRMGKRDSGVVVAVGRPRSTSRAQKTHQTDGDHPPIEMRIWCRKTMRGSHHCETDPGRSRLQCGHRCLRRRRRSPMHRSAIAARPPPRMLHRVIPRRLAPAPLPLRHLYVGTLCPNRSCPGVLDGRAPCGAGALYGFSGDIARWVAERAGPAEGLEDMEAVQGCGGQLRALGLTMASGTVSARERSRWASGAELGTLVFGVVRGPGDASARQDVFRHPVLVEACRPAPSNGGTPRPLRRPPSGASP